MDISQFRRDVDKLDSQIMSLLAARKIITDSIIEMKKEKRLSISDETREKEILSKADDDFVREVYGAIISLSKKHIKTSVHSPDI